MQTHMGWPIRCSVLWTLALSAVLVLGSFATGCGAATTPTPTIISPVRVTPTPVELQALVVTNSLMGAVVQQTQVAAIDPATGRQLWARAIMGHPGPFVPARAGDTVALSVGIPASPYPSSQVAGFDLGTGALLWSRDFGPNSQAFVGAAGARIIVVTSAVSTEAPGATRGLTVSALDPADGTPLWQRTLPNQELYGPVRSGDGAVYLVGGRTVGADTAFVLTALSVDMGTQIWQKELGTGSMLGMVAGDGAAFVGLFPTHLVADMPQQGGALAIPALSPFTASTLTAYRATDGAQLWQANGFAAPQATVNGTLYTTSAAPDGSGRLGFSLAAYKSTTGTRMWQSTQLGLGDPTSQPFAATDGHMISAFAMPETSPSVHALGADSGAPLWTALPHTVAQSGVVGLGHVFVATVPVTPPGQTPQAANVTITTLNEMTGVVQWKLVEDQSTTARLAMV